MGCTKAIDDTDNTYAWYWRGEAYYQSKRPDQALADLIKTADGEGYFAPYAAVTASMIYFDRNDDQAALDILNQYPFLSVLGSNRHEMKRAAARFDKFSHLARAYPIGCMS